MVTSPETERACCPDPQEHLGAIEAKQHELRPDGHDSPIAKVGLAVATTSIIALSAITIPFLRRFTGAPYVASSSASRAAIRTFLQSRSHQLKSSSEKHLRLVDLGSGSGELVLDAARLGFTAQGVELNLWLVLVSRLRAWRSGLGNKTTFEWRDMWDVHCGRYDVVVLFGVPGIMKGVSEKLGRECHDKAVVCSNTFEIEGWSGRRQGGVWFYDVADQRPTRFHSSLKVSSKDR